MGAARQPAQNVSGTDDRKREALGGAVKRSDEYQAVRLGQRRGQVNEPTDIGDVLDHFHGENKIKDLAGSRATFSAVAAR